jgi:hypothetical protein
MLQNKVKYLVFSRYFNGKLSKFDLIIFTISIAQTLLKSKCVALRRTIRPEDLMNTLRRGGKLGFFLKIHVKTCCHYL